MNTEQLITSLRELQERDWPLAIVGTPYDTAVAFLEFPDGSEDMCDLEGPTDEDESFLRRWLASWLEAQGELQSGTTPELLDRCLALAPGSAAQGGGE